MKKLNLIIIAAICLVLGLGVAAYVNRSGSHSSSRTSSRTSSTAASQGVSNDSNLSPQNFNESTADSGRPSAPVAGVVSTRLKPNVNANQTFYLWQKNNVPTTTDYKAAGGNDDGADFRPNMISFPVPKGTRIKGAVLINAGGAFQFRSNSNEGYPVAEALARRGYQSFVVNYRLLPYTQQEGALDLERGVRYVCAHAKEYGIHPNDVAVMGFSAGGILAGEMLLNYDGIVNGTALDKKYQPDALDKVPAEVGADGMIYSFYGQLSIASKDVSELRRGNLPPTYFCYGTEDPFFDEFKANIRALRQAGVHVQTDVLQGAPHGYGYRRGWIPRYDKWLTQVLAKK